MKIIVVDLDGTVCDSSHRDHLAQAKEWEAFHAAAVDDAPKGDVAFFLGLLGDRLPDDDLVVVACTGRNEKYRIATLNWLVQHRLAVFDDLLMRPDLDFTPDVELKPRLLDEWAERNGYSTKDVALILEDRDKVVEAWRNLGYKCWQVQQGGY